MNFMKNMKQLLLLVILVLFLGFAFSIYLHGNLAQSVLILALGTGIGFLAKKNNKKNESLDITTTVNKILPAAKYITLVSHYSDVGIHFKGAFTDSSISSLWERIKWVFIGKKAIYKVDGDVELGIDGYNIKIDCTSDKFIIRMPEIKIISHDFDYDSFKVYDEQKGWFAPSYTLRELITMLQSHKIKMENQVNNDTNLFTKAKESAEQQFTSLLKNIPEIKDKYSIEFVWEPGETMKAIPVTAGDAIVISADGCGAEKGAISRQIERKDGNKSNKVIGTIGTRVRTFFSNVKGDAENAVGNASVFVVEKVSKEKKKRELFR